MFQLYQLYLQLKIIPSTLDKIPCIPKAWRFNISQRVVSYGRAHMQVYNTQQFKREHF